MQKNSVPNNIPQNIYSMQSLYHKLSRLDYHSDGQSTGVTGRVRSAGNITRNLR